MFSRTSQALQNLEDLLRCQSCKKYMKEPVSLRNCDHMFCSTCINKAQKCPKCSMPLWLQDKNVSRKLQNVSNTCSQLKDQINLLQMSSNQSMILEDSGKLEHQNNQSIHQKHKMLEHFCTPVGKAPKRSKQFSTQESSNKGQESSIRKAPKSGQKNKKGESDLHIATIHGDFEELTILLQQGADVNAKDNAGWSSLHEACIRGHTDIAKKLLDFGAFVDIPGHGNDTPLMDAVANDKVETVKLLLEKGANTSLRNSVGKTAQSYAKSDIMKKLLSSTSPKSLLDLGSPVNNLPLMQDQATISFSSMIDSKKIIKLSAIIQCKVAKDSAFDATHFLTCVNDCGKAKRTLKYLQAIACGAWILCENWMDACIANNGWVDEVSFQIKGCLDDTKVGGPLRSLTSRLRQLPRLFNGCHFYLYGSFSLPYPNKKDLGDLIRCADGQILSRIPKPDSDCVQACTKVPYHADSDSKMYFFTYYIVYDPSQAPLPRMVQQGKVCTISVSWILDCLSQFCFVDTL